MPCPQDPNLGQVNETPAPSSSTGHTASPRGTPAALDRDRDGSLSCRSISPALLDSGLGNGGIPLFLDFNRLEKWTMLSVFFVGS